MASNKQHEKNIPSAAPELTHSTSHDPPDLAHGVNQVRCVRWMVDFLWDILWKSYGHPMQILWKSIDDDWMMMLFC